MRLTRCGSLAGLVSTASLGLILSACGGRDPVDAPVNWWHQLEGGAIAQQRPPPPGVDSPYPKVGTTPEHAPEMLSPQLRTSLTQHLIEQRNLAARLNANEPITTPNAGTPGSPPNGGNTKTAQASQPAPSGAPGAAPPAAGPGKQAAATGPSGATPAPVASSATFDAAEAPPAPPVKSEGNSPAGNGGRAGDGPSEPELAMPAIVPDQAGIVPASGPMPAIPAAPPSAPGLPGFAAPPGPSYKVATHPNYVLSDQVGEAIQFPDGSDAISPGQDSTIREVADKRGRSGIVYVHGFGGAASDAPSEQAQALTLATLRARAVADVLHRFGVPEDAIRIRADAFGRGATAGLID